MVEKWLRSRPNPYMRGTMKKAFGTSKAYYGKPVQLFKDSDKDGVPNVFDCKPKNRRRTDVLAPPLSGSPIQDMWGRQESSRLWAKQQAQLRALQKLEEERLAELKRLSNVQIIDRTITNYSTSYMILDPETGQYVSPGSARGREITKEQQAKSVGLNVGGDIKKPTITPPKITEKITVDAATGKTTVTPKKSGGISEIISNIGNFFGKLGSK